MKRFYQTVAIAETEGGFGVTLDGTALRTPARRALALPTRALAEALAAEWAVQGDTIRPETMPLMALIATAIDKIADRPGATAAEAAKYAGTDLLCYRAERPDSLVQRERAAWQPLLDWATDRFDAPLRVTSGVVPVAQPADSLKALRAALDGMDALTLSAVAALTATSGSLILALALWDGRLDATAAIEAALLDERFQNERWGLDAEAAQRQKRIAADIEAGAALLALLQPAGAHLSRI
jgi:chaperone required for assembly of F1-ATPase